MYQEFYDSSGLLIWPLIGLVLFVLSFVGVLWYVVCGLGDARKRDHLASLPLDDEKGGVAE